MNKIILKYFIALLVLVMTISLTNCESTTSPNSIDDSVALLKGDSTSGSYLLDSLDEQEAAGLTFMVEEEKLAHDVYVNFYEQYEILLFNNIANSEASHMSAIQKKLVLYGLDDPTENNDAGVFSNESLQELYNTLLTSGSESDTSALAVGALIEETDIIDLEEKISELDGNDDIARVYNNLLNGSKNHLRAFVKYLKIYGVEYQPQLLDQETFDTIINSTTKREGRKYRSTF